jgi:hypothetical protein
MLQYQYLWEYHKSWKHEEGSHNYNIQFYLFSKSKKSKAIPVTGREGP